MSGFTMSQFAGVEIRTSPYVGQLTSRPVPHSMWTYRGPYKHRRIRRWLKRHPAVWTADGTVLKVDGVYYVHPDDLRKIEQAVRPVAR